MTIEKKQSFFQTASLIAGFMVWVLLSSLMPFIKEDIPLPPPQQAWVMALPVLLALLFNLTGHYAIGFMTLSEFSLASLILVFWMFYQDKLKLAEKIIDHSFEGILVTDSEGIFQKVNSSFSKITGFSHEDVIGKTPSVLQSGDTARIL